MSPWALQARHAMELNMMDGTDDNLRHMVDAERTRSVAMAQHETIALAQILKVLGTQGMKRWQFTIVFW